MSGQRGAGNVAIPTLAFSDLGAFAGEAHRRGLGKNELNAVRVQPHALTIGACTCYEVHVTAFDDLRGCILAMVLTYGCYPTDTAPVRPDLKAWAKNAYNGVFDTLNKEHGLIVALGEWVHDPLSPGVIVDMLEAILAAERQEMAHGQI